MSEHEQQTAEEAQTADWSRLADEALSVDQKAGVLSDEMAAELAADESPEPEIQSAALLTDAIQATAGIFAPNWDLKREECEQLGTVYGALLDKYMPDSGLDKYGLEISAVMVTAMVLKSRAGVPRHKPKPKDKAKAKTETRETNAGENDVPVISIAAPLDMGVAQSE